VDPNGVFVVLFTHIVKPPSGENNISETFTTSTTPHTSSTGLETSTNTGEDGFFLTTLVGLAITLIIVSSTIGVIKYKKLKS
jgi:hypothetical protein